MSNILVTGGAGFIGSHLVKRLVQEGHNVKVLDILLRGNKIDHDVQKNIELHKVDIRDGNKVMKLTKNCDYIFHLAAILGVDVVADHPVETMEVETVGMQNIVDAVLKNGVEKVVYKKKYMKYSRTLKGQGEIILKTEIKGKYHKKTFFVC